MAIEAQARHDGQLSDAVTGQSGGSGSVVCLTLGESENVRLLLRLPAASQRSTVLSLLKI